MWKAQLRSKTNTPQIDLDIRPTPKRKDRNCREEFEAMKGKIESKADSLRGDAQLSETQGIDTTFSLSGLNRHFREMRENIPDEFYCKLLDAIKNITSSNDYLNPIKFDFNGKNYLVFYNLSYESMAGLSYYNYSGISISVRSMDISLNPQPNQPYYRNASVLAYMGFTYRGRDGYSYVPEPDFDKWKWW